MLICHLPHDRQQALDDHRSEAEAELIEQQEVWSTGERPLALLGYELADPLGGFAGPLNIGTHLAQLLARATDLLTGL